MVSSALVAVTVVAASEAAAEQGYQLPQGALVTVTTLDGANQPLPVRRGRPGSRQLAAGPAAELRQRLGVHHHRPHLQRQPALGSAHDGLPRVAVVADVGDE